MSEAENVKEKSTTLCYIKKDGQYLMMLRNKKKGDENAGKWIGVGGHVEEGETPDECIVREVKEETGLALEDFIFHGVIEYINTESRERMYLYTGTKFSGEADMNCNEGTLAWIRQEDIMALKMWEGDKYFLEKLLAGEKEINMKIFYEGDRLKEVFYE